MDNVAPTFPTTIHMVRYSRAMTDYVARHYYGGRVEWLTAEADEGAGMSYHAVIGALAATTGEDSSEVMDRVSAQWGDTHRADHAVARRAALLAAIHDTVAMATATVAEMLRAD